MRKLGPHTRMWSNNYVLVPADFSTAIPGISSHSKVPRLEDGGQVWGRIAYKALVSGTSNSTKAAGFMNKMVDVPISIMVFHSPPDYRIVQGMFVVDTLTNLYYIVKGHTAMYPGHHQENQVEQIGAFK